MAIGLVFLEKEIFEMFLPYMVMAAILAMWPQPCEQTFVLLVHGVFIWNLTLIRQAVSEEKMFENVDRRQTTDANRAYPYYKLTTEPKAQGWYIKQHT